MRLLFVFSWRTPQLQAMVVLMNVNFDYMTYANVEDYFELCLFYGFMPSFFSADGTFSLFTFCYLLFVFVNQSTMFLTPLSCVCVCVCV